MEYLCLVPRRHREKCTVITFVDRERAVEDFERMRADFTDKFVVHLSSQAHEDVLARLPPNSVLEICVGKMCQLPTDVLCRALAAQSIAVVEGDSAEALARALPAAPNANRVFVSVCYEDAPHFKQMMQAVPPSAALTIDFEYNPVLLDWSFAPRMKSVFIDARWLYARVDMSALRCPFKSFSSNNQEWVEAHERVRADFDGKCEALLAFTSWATKKGDGDKRIAHKVKDFLL